MRTKFYQYTQVILTFVVLMILPSKVWGQATTYTSNVTMVAGTNCSTCKVIVTGTTQYDGMKLGTSKATGTMTFTIPEGTTTIYLHAAGWNNDGNSRTLNISTSRGTLASGSTSMALTNDAGVSNNSPFTLSTSSNASKSYYKAISISGVTGGTATITLTTSAKRAVVWGINTASAASVSTPTFSPAAGTYNSAQNVTISCETTGANIYYTTDGSTPTSSSNAYSSAISISSTTTIKAIAIKSGTSSSVASATYTIQIPRTVTFSAQGGSCGTASLTEDSYGDGVVLPSASPSATCATEGWSFAGWKESSAQASTTTAPTLYVAGATYTPTDNCTLYAVYKKTEGGTGASIGETIYAEDFSGFSANDVPSSTTTGSPTVYNDGSVTYSCTNGGGTTKIYNETSAGGTSPELLVAKSNGSLSISGIPTGDANTLTLTYHTNQSSNLSVTTSTSKVSVGTVSTDATDTKLCTRTITFSSGVGSTFALTFTMTTSSNSRLDDISIVVATSTNAGTTTYNSNPSCCTPLGQINGSFNFTTPTTAVLTWDNVANVSSWAVSCILHGGSNAGSVGSITTNGSGKKTCTITGLSCNTNYDFTITATPNSGYCEKSETLENKNSGQYTVTSTLTGITPSSALPTTTCDGFTITSMSATSSTHHLPNDITVLGASYTWNSSTGNLVISSVTGNVTITIAAVENSCTHYSFHWGTTKGSEDQVTCLNFVTGTTDTYRSALWTVPTTGGWTYVGWQGGWHNDNAKSANLGMTSIPYDKDHSKTLQRAEAGNVGGAQGYIQVYGNSSDANKYVGFLPAGYVMRILNASSELQSTKTLVSADGTIDGNLWHTNDVFELTAAMISGKYDVDLKTSDGYVWAEGRSNTDNVAGMKVKNGNGTYRATDLAAGDAGMRGRFGIYANSGDNNWYCHFVPYYRVTYNGSGASGSTAASADVCCEGNPAARTVVAAANGFTVPTGKTFGGWASSPENAAAGVVAYAAGANVVLTSSITLYAIWTDINYTVTVNQNPNVSATTTGQTSSAHYNGTINLTTTVPSGYRFVNWTTSDGFSITNSTSATTASFTMPNKNVTVTANFQQTHKVDWYVGGSAPANKIGDDGQTTVVDHGGKISDFPATTPDGSACDKVFVGWTNTSSYVHGTSPLFTTAAGSPTINADASFYAVFAEGGSTEYVLTPAASLTAGEYVIAAYDDTNSKYLALTGAVSAAEGSNSDLVNETTGFTISEGKFSNLPDGACEFILTAYTGENENGFYIQNPANNYYLDYQGDGTTNRRLWYYNEYLDEDDNPIDSWAAWHGVALAKDGFPDNGMYLKYVDETYSLMSNGSGTTFIRGYANDNTKYKPIYLFKKTGGYTGHTITCSDCGTSVTPTFTAAPTGGTVAVTKKGGAEVTSGSTVKTCESVAFSVTLTPASHYSLTDFTATGLTDGTATITPNVATTLATPATTATTFTVTVSASATGTLNLTPTFTEDTRFNITWNVNGVALTPEAAEGLTFVYSGGNITALPSEPSVPAGCSGTKEFVGWSEENSGATEEDAAYYSDLFTTVGGAPTGITSAKTFYAVFATSAGDPLAGQTMWAEPWTGASSDKPDSPTSGATVYNSASITYTYNDGKSATKLYSTGDMLSGGAAAPELLISKTSPAGTWTVTNIPTGGSAYTELTLSYKTNRTTIGVTSATSGITIGDASNEGNTYTRTITISHSPSTVNNFALTFTNNGGDNARIDDISVIVPGSASLTDYVTTCAASYTITYNKNTTDPVTNLPSPTSVLQSTGSGTLSDKVPTRATYTFNGWAETTNGAVAYAAGASITGVSADKTLYAVWQKTAVTEIELSKSSLDKYVGDPAVTLTVTSVLPAGADESVTWSSSNTTVATVNATGEVNFLAVGTANIVATSTVTGTITATCAVTVWAKPTATFTDALHGLTTDENGVSLSSFNLEAEQGTPVVFPTLANQDKSAGTCEGEYYIFVGWTTSDNNDDPEDHLVTSHFLANGEAITYYAVWADAASSTTYTKLTTNSFKTSPTKYVLGAENNGTEYFFSEYNETDADLSWGVCSSSDAPIQFTLSGTASALVAKDASGNYLVESNAKKKFRMSSTSATVQLQDGGTIKTESFYLRYNYNSGAGGLRFYEDESVNPAYFYEVTSGGDPHYRTSCCANKVDAPVVTVTQTSTSITLNWPADAKATGWEVSWNGGAFGAPSGTRTHTVSGLTPNTTYTWKVRATYSAPQCGADTRSGSTTTNQVYHVTYAKGDGEANCSAEGSTTDAMAYEAGATVTLQANGFTLSGHTFAGWTEDDEDVAISNNQFTMPEHDVVITASWTAKMDKYFDRMHDQTDSSHGGVAETEGTNEGKYYIAKTGCSYSAPTVVDSKTGDACQTTHYKLRGWIAASYVNAKGEITDESKIFSPGTTKTAGGFTYYAVWAEVTE